MEDRDKDILLKIKYITRLKTLLTKVNSMGRSEKYQLYMNMMGHEPYMVEGDNWAFILHRMVAGRHNIAEYQNQVDKMENGLLTDHGINVVISQILAFESKFLDPVLDLAPTKMRDFYEIAGKS